MNWFFDCFGSYIKDSKIFTQSGIAYEYAFIRSCIEFSKIIFPVIMDEAYASKNMEVRDIQLYSFV